MLVVVVVIVMTLMLVVVVVVVMTLMLIIVIMVVVLMMMLRFFKKLLKLVVEGVLLHHCVNDLLTGELIPVGRNYRSGRVLLTKALYAVIELVLRQSLCMA